jgi:outer membrane protein OmpA-like peptidoglycan-associated protein
VEGFTDSTGTAEHNLLLSQRRAESVRTALMNMGIAGTRISTRGYGEEYPVASNANSADRQLNRRVEIVLSDAGRTVSARQH